jgi:hypothetical protein
MTISPLPKHTTAARPTDATRQGRHAALNADGQGYDGGYTLIRQVISEILCLT